MHIVNIFAVHFFANHNKDYSVVKTFKVGLNSLAFFVGCGVVDFWGVKVV